MKKIVLVTGANKGIGLEAVKQLAQKGMTVWLAARNAKIGLAAATAYQERNLDVHFVELDVTSNSSVTQAYQKINKQHSCLDILVNNAGINLDWSTPPSETNLQHLTDTINTNLIGVVRVTNQFLPLMKDSKDARIINVSSLWGSLTTLRDIQATAPAYHISKAALNMWTLMLGNELKKNNITVNSISPGWVKTDMGGETAPRSVDQGASIITKLASQSFRPTCEFLGDEGSLPW